MLEVLQISMVFCHQTILILLFVHNSDYILPAGIINKHTGLAKTNHGNSFLSFSFGLLAVKLLAFIE